jgi:DNA-binding MarR family transcriptional regulator
MRHAKVNEPKVQRSTKPSRKLPLGLLKQSSQLAEELSSSVFRLERNIRRRTRESGRSAGELQILQAIGQDPGVTQSELADQERVSRPSISAHVSKLVRLGLVKASQAEQQRPGIPVGLHITRAGRALVQRTTNPSIDWLTQRLAALKPEEHRHICHAIDSLQVLFAQDAL